jgi:hypothetical protein
MPELKYVGDGSWVGGWPASDHEEKDGALAERKIESGLYELAAPLTRSRRESGESEGE